MGHGYLVHQFYSPYLNHRSDEYGGTVENRLRFAREVLNEIMKTAPEVPIIVRLSASEFTDTGLNPEDLEPLIRLLEENGVAALHLGFGNACDSPAWYYQHMALPEESQLEMASRIRKMTDLPTILVGRMVVENKINRVLSEGIADLIAMARPLVADPNLPNKIIKGDDERFLCGSCLQGCLMNVKTGKPIGCIINPMTDIFDDLKTTTTPKRILVIGGGPAGMMATVTLSMEGHDVILAESEQELGGQFNYAPLALGKERMRLPLESLKRAAYKNVKVMTGTKVDLDFVKKLNPEFVIVATGAKPRVFDIPGLENISWTTGTDALLDDEMKGKRVIIIGGGLIGMEVAEKLVEQGNEVTVIEMREKIGEGMEPITQKLMNKRLKSAPINIYTKAIVKEITPEGVNIKFLETGEEKNLGLFDILVFAAGTSSENSLEEELKEAGIPYEMVGDARELSQIIGAVREAYELAKTI